MEEFLHHAFSKTVDSGGFLEELFDLKKENQLAYLADCSKIQESFRLRVLNRSLKIAEFLINEAGELDLENLNYILCFFAKTPYILSPNGENDFIFTDRQLGILRRLPELFPSIKRFQKPLCHTAAEKLIRDTFQFFPKTVISNAHIRRAVLGACLTLLRQNVGSCFATAPAILIQEQQIARLVADLYELLYTGKLKRVIAGTEFMVPLSPSWGWGDLGKKIDLGNVECCPGFLIALTRVGILDPQMHWEEKRSKAAAFITPFLGKGLTVQDLLRAVLIGHFGIRIEEKEKDVRSAFKAVCDHPLLKAWEFTLASFSEAKMEFSRWNLYLSLGLQHGLPGGIGQVLYDYADQKLKESNAKVDQYQLEYENAFNQVKAVEGLLRNAGSEEESRRLRAEYQGRYYNMQGALDSRNRAYSAASQYSSLYAFMIKQYDEKFPEYFQEIYDPEMQDVSADIYDDSPAGFRLVYKHGRQDASLWSFIYDGEQFINMLVDFFRMTEMAIASACEWEEGKCAIQEMTTMVILHVRSKEFLRSSIERRNLPWAYISGGSMAHLLKIYFRKEMNLSEEERWVESESELLIFFLDTLKNLPAKPLEDGKKMLMFSPTHACILEPKWEIFEKGWRHGGFTYTWVRDEIIEPARDFYRFITLSMEHQQFLIDRFSEKLPPLIAHYWRKEFFIISGSSSISKFREQMKMESLLSEWDGFLFEMLPLLPFDQWKDTLKALIPHPNLENVLEEMHPPYQPWLGRRDVLYLAKAAYLLAENATAFSFDVHQVLEKKARELKLSPPAPLIFADTNWPNFFFAFLLNPGTLSLELWRTDATGSYGRPMHSWKHYMNGKDKKSWGLFTHPYQYS